jgi:hypothetical protein
MTGPEDSQNTRPISVAELLARNGTIGAPPAGGRRRRRRGDTDSISVAELTGEIPIITDHVVDQPVADQPVAEEPVVEEPVVEESPADEATAESETEIPEDVVDEPVDESTSPASSNGVVDHTDVETEAVEESEDVEADVDTQAAKVDHEADQAEEADAAEEADDDYADAVSDYAAHIEQRDTDDDLPFFTPPRRSGFAQRRLNVVGDAEEMSPDPDPVDEDTVLDWSESEAEAVEDDDVVVALRAVGDVKEDAKDSDSEHSYLRSTAGPLFGGQSVADDLARRGTTPGPEDIDLDEQPEQAESASPQKPMSSFMHGVWIVGQCVLAVAFGAGLFVAFDQLWKWNNIVALVLSVLVILGLVVGVRVVRKTEDIGSTLIAVAVGALVTLGPLALLQSG